MFKNVGITVIFPCYNDEKSIGKLITNAYITLKDLTNNYEVVVVNDGSTDNSPKILENLKKNYKELKIFTHHKNRGYGGALQTGLKKASKELVFYTDGDGQYDVKELPILFALMSEDVNFINGIKMARHDPSYRIILGNLYSFLVRWFFWLPIYDVDCDYRLIRRSLLTKINLTNTSGAVCVELVKKAQRAGAKFRQVSVHHFERKYGTSQFFRLEKLLSTLGELIGMWIELMLFR